MQERYGILMLIQTYKKDYYIIERKKTTEEQDVFICEENGKKNGLQYLLIHIKKKECVYQVIPFFSQLKNHTVFQDYIDCFSKNGTFYLVFQHKKEKTLEVKLKEICDFRERLEVGKRLLEKMILLDMPFCIQYDILTTEKIMISEHLQVSFYYELSEYQQYFSITIKYVMERLQCIIEQLFIEELKGNYSIWINEFYESLKQDKYHTYFDIYQAYNKMYEQLLTNNAYQYMRPNIKRMKIWDTFKRILHQTRPIISIVLILGSILYLIMSSVSNKTLKEGTEIISIGTVKILQEE